LASPPRRSPAPTSPTAYTCFAHTRDAIEVRLVVRRVRPTPGSQLALFTDWDYHAMATDRAGDLLQVEADHRRHAVVEQPIAELKSAGLAHLPSGRFMANAAWLALAVTAHNLGRASARWPVCAGPPRRRCAGGCSPSPAGWCTPPAGCIYDYRPTGPGPQRSSPP
jgi:hypothetical protein